MQPTQNNDFFKGIRWFLGAVFLTAFSSAIITYGALTLTSEEKMQPMLAKTLNIVFRQNGMEETTRVVNYLNELYKQKDAIAEIQKINPEKIQRDIEKMSPEESQKYLEETLAKPLYENGTKIVEPLKAVNPNAAIDAERLDFLSMANANSNQTLKKALNYQAIVLIIVLLLLIVLSKGIKRLSTPATLIFVASLPGLLFFGLFNGLAEKFIKPILGQYAEGPIYSALMTEVISPMVETMRNIHLVPALIGLSLIILSIVLKLVLRPAPMAAEAKPAQVS